MRSNDVVLYATIAAGAWLIWNKDKILKGAGDLVTDLKEDVLGTTQDKDAIKIVRDLTTRSINPYSPKITYTKKPTARINTGAILSSLADPRKLLKAVDIIPTGTIEKPAATVSKLNPDKYLISLGHKDRSGQWINTTYKFDKADKWGLFEKGADLIKGISKFNIFS